jgi:hypothetical protein
MVRHLPKQRTVLGVMKQDGAKLKVSKCVMDLKLA